MVNVTILLISMALLYSLLSITPSNSDLKADFDINVGGAGRTCSGLFFIVLLAHIQLRQSFSGYGIVHMEYFYLIS